MVGVDSRLRKGDCMEALPDLPTKFFVRRQAVVAQVFRKEMSDLGRKNPGVNIALFGYKPNFRGLDRDASSLFFTRVSI
jgi:hypothetical protein